ncbi:MAG TPA: serine protease [Planctomycetota bacterium]|nr:serine protease [Planctomycetota bacterium]
MKKSALLPALGLLVFACDLIAAQEQPEVIKSAVRLRHQRTEKDEIVTGWGSAVAVDLSDYGIQTRRYLLSAAHLVLNKNGKRLAPGQLAVELENDGRTSWVGCKVVAVDDKADLCLLECNTDLSVLAKLGSGKENVGEEVLIVGCPSGVTPRISRGKLTTKTPNVEGELWQAAAKFWHGNSGGPVFNPNTKTICGIAVAGVKADDGNDMDPNIALFAPIGPVRRFLNAFARLNDTK